MCKNIFFVFGFFVFTSIGANAQITDTTGAENHSHWTAGISVSEPFIFCNLTSLAANKTYWGIGGGFFGGYQCNPIIGFSFAIDYATNKAGAFSYAFGRKLGPDGTTYYLPSLPGTNFSDLYSKISFLNIGLQATFNLNRIIFRPLSVQRFTVLFQPSVYLQHFKSKVCDNSGKKITDGTLNGGIDLGLGGEMALRARINNSFDAQLSSGIIWTTNNTFDGVKNMSTAKDDYIWNTKISLIYKINRSKKGEKDNILYAPPLRENISPELQAALQHTQQREEELGRQQQELAAQLKLLRDKQTGIAPVLQSGHTVDTLYIIQKDTNTQNANPLQGQEDWVIRIIQKIKTEQPEVIEQVGYQNLVKQVIEAREKYAGYYTDEKTSVQPIEDRTTRYAVQIYAMTNPFPVSFFRNTPDIRVVRLVKDGLYRYLYAVYDNMDEARAALPEIQKKYWDAFVREFDDQMIKNALILNDDYSDFPINKKK